MKKAVIPINKVQKEKTVLRILILLGILGILNFYYWFLDLEFVDSRFLYILLVIVVSFNIIRLLFIWYHYWSIKIPEKPDLKSNFSVDVFTTFFPGEPYEMVKETLTAIQKISYPHTTYLCDEANDSHLKQFCLENNIKHVTRNNRVDAKAGNINNALKQATGDVCLILDPDHVPKEKILTELIPFFENEEIGFVQSVQAYYNINESQVAKGAAEQTFHFYGPIMMSMNSYGTVNAIGANCLFRRKALDSIGGHAAGLSEDMHTAMQLHAKGWKSIYIPEILTRGLVPATLTSYYKQQLKWSRGTLELLFSVYPKLFGQFTFRQKLHYGLLPFHYFSGVIYFISFLIPLFSLFWATTPWKGNIVNFGLFYLPVLISILGIRFYVQRWVIEKTERGLHITGGLLQSATWWIFLTGFIYTVFRKKVPYLPTPKNDQESTNFILLLPNILIGIISIIAIIYGLSIDFTPFAIFMSGFALLNAFFMFYTILFAFEQTQPVNFSFSKNDITNTWFEKLKDIYYQSWRKLALGATIAALVLTFSFQQYRESLKWETVKPDEEMVDFVTYFGMYEPNSDNGFTDLSDANSTSRQINVKLDLISMYIAWDRNQLSTFPKTYIDSVYKQQAIPVITWEPWLNSFQNQVGKDAHIYDLIGSGYFDGFITDFSTMLKELKRPVFLRFAHEFDNPFYPWYVPANEAAKFKSAWIHVYEIFKNNNARNVIWIWNPWDSKNIKAFYPGPEYLDWIGVNILNYHLFDTEIKNSFDSLYLPFHREFAKLPRTPVMIPEFGTLNDGENQTSWIGNAFRSIESNYHEIESVIYFNSKFDDNFPEKLTARQNYLDWTIPKEKKFDYKFTVNDIPDYVINDIPDYDPKIESKEIRIPRLTGNRDILGINLKKGHDWHKDYHVLSRKNLEKDFAKMKDLGINTIRFEGNSVYDNNVVNIAEEQNIDISYGFWIPEDINFVRDSLLKLKIERQILKKIRKLKNHKNIVSWSIQNDVFENQKDYFRKPELMYQNQAYMNWLRELSGKIKKIDGRRPLMLDMEVHLETNYFSKLVWDNIPEIDAIGLIVKNDKELNTVTNYFEQNKINYQLSEIEVQALANSGFVQADKPFFVTAWQDQHERNKITFDGITDRFGRYKTDYFLLNSLISQSSFTDISVKTRILRPAVLLREGKQYNYLAMLYDDKDGWIYSSLRPDLTYEWSLIKCDEFGNSLAIKKMGEGYYLQLKIPEKYDGYRLMLTILKDDIVVATTRTTLNTPLYQ